MAKALVTAMIGLMVLSASANASDHRTGTYGYHGRYAGPTTPNNARPAPNVPQQKNWGCCTWSGPWKPSLVSGQNVRDHRSVRR